MYKFMWSREEDGESQEVDLEKLYTLMGDVGEDTGTLEFLKMMCKLDDDFIAGLKVNYGGNWLWIEKVDSDKVAFLSKHELKSSLTAKDILQSKDERDIDKDIEWIKDRYIWTPNNKIIIPLSTDRIAFAAHFAKINQYISNLEKRNRELELGQDIINIGDVISYAKNGVPIPPTYSVLQAKLKKISEMIAIDLTSDSLTGGEMRAMRRVEMGMIKEIIGDNNEG